MSTPLTRSLTSLLLAAGLVLAPVAAHAETNETEPPVNLSLRPVNHPGSYFDLTVEPGESQELTVLHDNHGEVDIEARSYPADAYTIVNGGFGAQESGNQPTGTTTWLDYNEQELSLPAGLSTQQTLTLTVPEDTEPGQYTTSLVLENAEPVEGSGEVALDQTVRQALPILIRVPGELNPAFEFGQADHRNTAGRSVVDVEITNTGNAHLEPAGDLIIRDSGEEVVSEASIAMSDFLAGTKTTVETTLRSALQPGDYTLSASMTDSQSQTKASFAGLPFTVEDTAQSPAVDAAQDLPDVNQNPAPGPLVYILGTVVLALMIIVIYLIRRSRKAEFSHHVDP